MQVFYSDESKKALDKVLTGEKKLSSVKKEFFKFWSKSIVEHWNKKEFRFFDYIDVELNRKINFTFDVYNNTNKSNERTMYPDLVIVVKYVDFSSI